MSDARFMAGALALGRRGLGLTAPNPSVGALIVKDGRVIGAGATAPGGRPHAETQALAEAGLSARGATVYVTLEPCAHQGVTPPCAAALVAAGVARVVCALEDPDPRVAGRGLKLLRDAGIEVALGVGAQEARRDHLGHILRVTQGRPMVTLKLAQTAQAWRRRQAHPFRQVLVCHPPVALQLRQDAAINRIGIELWHDLSIYRHVMPFLSNKMACSANYIAWDGGLRKDSQGPPAVNF